MKTRLAEVIWVIAFCIATMAALAYTTHPDPTYTRDSYCYDTLHGTPRPDGCHLPGGTITTPPQDDQ